jgi:7-keto-8-aminopelargonate synthetase-like enzyme
MKKSKFLNNWQKKKILTSKQYQSKAFEKINNLVVKARQKRQIFLSDGTQLTEFMSCSYLGLDQDKRVISSSADITQYGVNFAVSRTRMRIESSLTLEKLLNKIFLGHCVTFTSLHLVHLGMLPLLASGEMPSYPMKRNGPLFILDKTAHASIQINQGLMQQFGEVNRIDFNHTCKLEEQLQLAQTTKRTPIIIADGVGSMGGKIAIQSIFKLADEYEAYVYLDDAHGVSVYGTHGCGYVLNELGYFHPRLILAVSLSKAFGAHGAAVVLPTIDDENITREFAIPYVFSNPLPATIINSAIAAAYIHLSDEISTLQNSLQSKISHFDQELAHSSIQSKIINYQSTSPIRGLLIGEENKAIEITDKLRSQYQLAVTAAMYPTTAKGKAILRITLGADHQLSDIENLAHCLNQLIEMIE